MRKSSDSPRLKFITGDSGHFFHYKIVHCRHVTGTATLPKLKFITDGSGYLSKVGSIDIEDSQTRYCTLTPIFRILYLPLKLPLHTQLLLYIYTYPISYTLLTIGQPSCIFLTHFSRSIAFSKRGGYHVIAWMNDEAIWGIFNSYAKGFISNNG